MDTIIPLINADRLRENLPHCHDAQELMVRGQQSVAEEYQALSRAWADNNRAALAFHTHRLASASFYLGLDAIGLPAIALKKQIEHGADQTQIVQSWTALQAACESLQQHTPKALRRLVAQCY